MAAWAPEASFGVEWAAGNGSLTELLLDPWEYLVALELDFDFCRTLRDRFSTRNLGVIRADLTEYPLPVRRKPYPVFGNLPYHVTGPLLVKLVRGVDRISRFQGLVQWEVAQRLNAQPGSSSFRSISVLVQWAFEVELRDRVPASAFTPEPDVDSGWIDLRPRDPEEPVEPFRSFLETCFQQPRKTLLNNLSGESGDKELWRNWMDQRGWDARRRPHSLSVDEYREVFREWNRR
jgi:16S rRNA (adenine1518-N6/adenine1519-N6)-dimethyltransferase